jgi:adenylylsulfate kinase-like enzyme
MLTWITGNSKSGKTTLAKTIIASDGGILLDGDSMRGCWTLGFSKEDRIENNLRIAKIAKMLDAQGFNVVVSTICPYRELREQVNKICFPRWIYLSGGIVDKDYPYEP